MQIEEKAAPAQWQPIGTAPKNGILLDVLFDVATADAGDAEWYAAGCTRYESPTEPIIKNVAYVNGGFKPVIDAAGAREVAERAGGWGHVTGVLYGIIGLTLTHWRIAQNPFVGDASEPTRSAARATPASP